MKKSLITTPRKWYFIGLFILFLFLLGWIVFSLFDCDKAQIISDIAKNSFFAIGGSLLVSFIIDIGNTSRENKIQENAFLQLKSNMDSIYSCIAGISFVLKKCVEYEKDGKIILKYFYNKEFYYKDDNVISFVTLTDISNFKQKIEPFISKIMLSNSFVHLNYELGEAIEKLAIEKFYFIGDLREEIIEHGVVLLGMKNDIEMLDKIVKILGDSLGRTNNFIMLEEEDANNHHNDRIEFRREHEQELLFIEKTMRK